MNTPLITWYTWCPVKQIYPAVIRGLEFGDWVQTIRYTCGDEPPHYPVPALPIQIGWEPGGEGQEYPSAYWWVCSEDMLWSIFEKWGLVREYV